VKHLLLVILLAFAAPAFAVNPDEMLADPKQEQRARDLGRDLRCLVCQNQSIDDSDAELARDLRVIVRERIKRGDNDDQVMKFVTDRYGDYVLLKPPFKPVTYFLWIGPAIILVLAVIAALAFYRRRAGDPVAPAELSAEESRRLAKLMKEDGGS
jgi:cytochrome c-type biogenesis protein CcmH